MYCKLRVYKFSIISLLLFIKAVVTYVILSFVRSIGANVLFCQQMEEYVRSCVGALSSVLYFCTKKVYSIFSIFKFPHGSS